jgi:hypothetical protein
VQIREAGAFFSLRFGLEKRADFRFEIYWETAPKDSRAFTESKFLEAK